MPRLGRKKMVGKEEDLDRFAREQAYQLLEIEMCRARRAEPRSDSSMPEVAPFLSVLSNHLTHL